MSPPPHDTRTSLLDAAERLLASRGFAQASLRSITRAAGANLAAVSYHFGSKRELIREALRRRLEPVNGERLRRLDLIEAAGGADVEAIVRAFIEPTIDMVASDPEGASVARLVLRAFTEPGDEVRALLEEQFTEVAARFVRAFAAALPELEPADVHWRFHFLIGSLAFTVGLADVLRDLSAGACGTHDPQAAREQLVRYAQAGLEAPAAGRPATPAARSTRR